MAFLERVFQGIMRKLESQEPSSPQSCGREIVGFKREPQSLCMQDNANVVFVGGPGPCVMGCDGHRSPGSFSDNN